MDQFLRLAGMLLLIGLLLTLAAALLASVYAIGRGNRRLLRNALLMAAAATTVHAILVLAGPLLIPSRVLAEGSEVSFCGFDCHLHVSARRGASPDAVVLRFRSDAGAVPEHPGWLRVLAYDTEGVSHEPLDPISATLLAAGDTLEQTLRFPQGARIERAVVTWREWDRYLVPGPGNPLVQARTSLALGDAESNGNADTIVRQEES
jgi:hypothetical protein